MKYPHPNFPQDWSLTAGYEFSDPTSYGFHDGLDVNDKKGGDSDLGQPIYAEADGVIDLIHNHTSQNTFGNHYFLKIEGPWGTRWMHHAHCQQILVKLGEKVKEGQLIAKLGKSGTGYSHDHWSCCKSLTIDNLANNQMELESFWEDPVEFVEKWQSVTIPVMEFNNQTKIPLNVVTQLETYKERELQAVRSDYIAKDQALKDKDNRINDLNIANSQQAEIIADYENQVEKLNEDLEKVVKDFKAYKEQVENTPEPPIKPPVVDPLPQSSLADLVRSLLKKLGF